MTPYNSREFAALMHGVRERPDDDLPRLVVADWLEENGCEWKARFIREQIEHHPVAPPLLLALEVEDFLGCQPHECFRYGRKEHALSNRAYAQAISKPVEDYMVYWRRGFVDVLSGPLATLIQHGPAIARGHCLTGVTVTDKEPIQLHGGWWGWVIVGWGREGRHEYEIPEAVWHYGGIVLNFPTREAAMTALNATTLAEILREV